MKNLFHKLMGLLPHTTLILSLMMITFVITDRYNRAMAFINNDITKALLLILALLVILQSILLIRSNRKRQWQDYNQFKDSDKQ